jgi:hypothetical protein
MSLLNPTAWAGTALLLCAVLAGCGTPGAPQPPSLNLPAAVADLAAVRTGNQVTLTWTMPKRNTDKTAIRESVTAHICRREGTGECNPVADESAEPGNPAAFTDNLPNALESGEPRPVSYFVELLNKKSRSAGLSNGATVLGGAAPGAVEGLKAEVRKQGVVLSWTTDGEKAPVRLVRKLLTPPKAKSQQQGPLTSVPEAANQSMLVEAGVEQGRALDQTTHLNESYEYRAQRLVRVDVNGKTLELAGELSAPIDVDVKDVFPPAVPTGLAAVASEGGDGKGASIDLNWQPNSEPDLAGYIVYRRENGGGWQRISPVTPSVEPAFHDAQVQAGHTYQYVVSAVDKGGHESERSEVAEETVPQD